MDKTHVPYPGCYCADCVENPSARITGDKDRSVQSRAPTNLTTRLHSFAKALETGFDFNVMKHLDVSMCCDGHMCGCQGSTVGQYLAHQLRGELPEEKLTEANRQLAIECHRLRAVLRWIAETGYVDHQSGNQNFEHLQSIARDALTKD